MNKKEAQGIAREALYILHGCREEFPGAYEYFMGEMDLSDEDIDSAFKTLFPDEG